MQLAAIPLILSLLLLFSFILPPLSILLTPYLPLFHFPCLSVSFDICNFENPLKKQLEHARLLCIFLTYLFLSLSFTLAGTIKWGPEVDHSQRRKYMYTLSTPPRCTVTPPVMPLSRCTQCVCVVFAACHS